MDTFNYIASDGELQSLPKTVTVFIIPESVDFSGESLEFAVLEDDGFSLNVREIYSTIPSGGLFSILEPSTNGLASLDNDNFNYVPNKDFYGRDQVSLKFVDPQGNAYLGQLIFNIVPLNDPPAVENAHVSAISGQPILIKLSGQDVDLDEFLSWQIVSMPSHGFLVIQGDEVIYTSESGFEGEDTFTFLVSDGVSESNVAAVNISVVSDDGNIQAGVPVITLIGETLILHEAGIPYQDAGAIALDPEEGQLAVTLSSQINHLQLGEQEIQYSAIDSQGNRSVPLARTVQVIDTTPPDLILVGPTLINHVYGDPFMIQVL